jgi:3-mercaptopyruvate sulfurtransferase SseA
MFRHSQRVIVVIVALMASLLSTSQCWALSAAELASMMKANVQVVVIDVRNRNYYSNGHIPGAISIPAEILARKKLPRFSNVVIYGDGIHVQATNDARDALAANLGIVPQILDGGYPVWEAYTRLSTKGGGMSDEVIPHITYQELMKIKDGDSQLTIIDLRQPGKRMGTNNKVQKLTDLASKFPRHQVLSADRARWSKHKQGHVKPGEVMPLHTFSPDVLYVLVDNGDGHLAESVARRLRGKGIKRLAILTGGEVAIETEGQASEVTVNSGK